ncbi:MAG: NAD(P)/FAD-dependent oxidoreductase [Bacteroidetes bacterium]|nr:NAD(P)/FAD-dependent oxidoreductase [Bacteroidota bacterium]
MTTHREIIIAGAGFAGICMAIRLREVHCTDLLILERNSAIGGTWYDNSYPGAACDVESHLYSFSFAPNPAWSRQFGPQQEILRYMDHCVDAYGLRDSIRLQSEVASATFEERTGLWHIATTGGQDYTARFFVSCSGGLSDPSYPAIPGIDTFSGHIFHSARWDHSYDYRDKRVAVIGTGASAIQIIPAIVDRVRKLEVFQRTPAWVIPKPDKAISSFRKAMYERLGFMRALYRWRLYWQHELMAIGFVVNPGLLRLFGKVAARHIRRAVQDPVLRKKLTPSYVIGCKRILLSNDYYPALQKSNVSVVTDGISEINSTGVRTVDGAQYDVDLIVLATGFQAAENITRFVAKGLGGRDLTEAWQHGAEAYLGTTVNGFPNMFLVVGPNTGLGHSSMLLMIEAQVGYIVQAIQQARQRSAIYLNVKKAVQQEYNRKLQDELSHSVWQSGGCHSWYQNKDGKNVTLWPGFTFTFMKRTKHFDPDQYDWATS